MYKKGVSDEGRVAIGNNVNGRRVASRRERIKSTTYPCRRWRRSRRGRIIALTAFRLLTSTSASDEDRPILRDDCVTVAKDVPRVERSVDDRTARMREGHRDRRLTSATLSKYRVGKCVRVCSVVIGAQLLVTRRTRDKRIAAILLKRAVVYRTRSRSVARAPLTTPVPSRGGARSANCSLGRFRDDSARARGSSGIQRRASLVSPRYNLRVSRPCLHFWRRTTILPPNPRNGSSH